MNDGFEPRSEFRGRVRPFASFLVALRFLTRLPVPFVRTLDPPPLRDSMAMFPVVGAVVGAISGGALIVANLAALPDLFCGLFALAAGAVVTGAFHEDGLADVADGFGGGHTREDRLDIMKDSRIGTYGTLTLCLTLLARASLLTALLDLPPLSIVALLAGAAAFSRALMVDLLWATRPARSNRIVGAGRPAWPQHDAGRAGDRRHRGRFGRQRSALAASRGSGTGGGGTDTRPAPRPGHAQDRRSDRRCLRCRTGSGRNGDARGLRRNHFFTLKPERSCTGDASFRQLP